MEKGKKYLTHILAVILLFIGVTASFVHKGFPAKDPLKKELTKERGRLKESWNLKEQKHDELLLSGKITRAEYKVIKDQNELDRIHDFKDVASRRKVIAKDFSFNGRISKNFWFWMLGIFTTMLICSSYLAIKDARLKKAGILKWYEPIASISFIAVSLFWLYHTIFQTTRDFKLSTYTLYLVLVLVPLSYFIYQVLRSIKSVEDKLKNAIKSLIDFISIKAKNKYVSDNDKLEYTKDYLAEIKKTRNNE